ncbi:MAG: hypothetical protein COB93_12390 [Sneathiella sp.]|nr:MAG: hypothetical protein COB93_12390 [Sneathiella sp.]
MRSLYSLIIVTFLLVPNAFADKAQENLFATVYLKGDKVGTVHLTTVRNENDELEELNANASVSFLGLEVYGFTQNLQERWEKGDLQSMDGKTDDNGTAHEITLKRGAENYDANYNKKALTLPLDAFPTSPWHYDITKSKLLFNIVDFELLKVEIKESPDTVEIGGKKIETTKFVFTGDWAAVLWFDKDKMFVKGEYDISGRQVTVILD